MSPISTASDSSNSQRPGPHSRTSSSSSPAPVPGLGAAGLAGGFVGALPTDIGMGDGGRMPLTITWALLYTALSAVLGLGVGLIVRHGAGATSGLFI